MEKNGKYKWLRRILIFFGCIALIFVLLIFALWLWAKPESPDSFYNTPENVPSEHGILLKKEEFNKDIPKNAKAWRILYTTTRENGKTGVASAIVVTPTISEGAKPIVSYSHGTIGVVPGCAPSIVEEQFPNGSARELLEQSITNEWVFVSSDYIGLGTKGPHPFLIGEGEAYSSLDAIKAAQQLTDIKTNNEVIIWGHSQGGHAALWSGIVAPKYTPELNVLGVAALSPASDLVGLVQNAQNTAIGKILSSFIVSSYSDTYSDVSFNDVVKPQARLLTKDISSRCLSGKKTLVSAVEAEKLIKGSIFKNDPAEGNFGKRLIQNTPTQKITYPLFIGQGKADDLVLPQIQNKFVKNMCKAGQELEYKTYENRGHLEVLAKDSPLISDLIGWTQDRLDKNPQVSNCDSIN